MHCSRREKWHSAHTGKLIPHQRLHNQCGLRQTMPAWICNSSQKCRDGEPRRSRKQKKTTLELVVKLANTPQQGQPQEDVDIQTLSQQIPAKLRRRGKEWHGKLWFSAVSWDWLDVNELSLCIYVCRKLQTYINTWHIKASHKWKQ